MAKRTLQCVESHSVLYHPDYDRRPRDHTESADLVEDACRKQTENFAKRSRAIRLNVITAGGESHPAPRTLN